MNDQKKIIPIAKTVREWYAYHGGEESGVTLEQTSKIWDAAIKSITPRKLTIKDIIKKYLVDNGYDGLCNEECGCGIAEMPACCGPFDECQPAYKVQDKCPECKNECTGYLPRENQFCYKTEKQKGVGNG